MKILFLSRWFPFPADNGSKIRIYNLICGLSRYHEVTLLSFYDPQEISPEKAGPYPSGLQVQVVPWKPYDERSHKAKLGFLSLIPRSLLDTYSPEMDSLIRQAVSSQNYDLIIASQLTMASYYPAFRGVPAIFEEIELGLYVDRSLEQGNWRQVLRHRMTWWKLKMYARLLLDSFAMSTVVSEREFHIFAAAFPTHRNRVQLLQNCLNMDEYQGISPSVNPHQIVFAGSFRYYPNYEAVRWFIEKVFPLILEKIPQAHLIITGDTANLPLPEMRNVNLAGYVQDIKTLIAASRLSITPLWTGGGTRLKILEAMALGTPVVSTSKGAEGLIIEHEENILIADEPHYFAESVLRLLCDDELRNRLSSNARRLVNDQYNWTTRMPEFLNMVEKVAVQ
jgi:polysaccharide biosynthesis protein PslH